MGIIKAEIDDETKKKLWKKAFEKFGYSRGSVSLAIKEAINKWLEEKESGAEDIEKERILNNLAYLKMKDKLVEEYEGKYVLIANGKFIAAADTFDDIVRIANEKAGTARHRLIFKVERKMLGRKGRLGWRTKVKGRAGTT